MQAVPYTAFTTKSVEPGNLAKPVQNTSYGMRNQASQHAFAHKFQQAARELSGQRQESATDKPANAENRSVKETDYNSQKQTTNNVAKSDRDQASCSKTHEVQAKEGDNSQADAPQDSQQTMNLIQQLLELLQMLGLAGDTQVTGQASDSQTGSLLQSGDLAQANPELLTSELAQLPQATNLAALIKALTGQDENLQQILAQLQKDLQQLSEQFKANGYLSNQDNLAGIRQELLAALNPADSDVLNDPDFLVKLAGAVAKIAEKTAGKGEASDPNILNASKMPEAGQTATGNQTIVNTSVAGEKQLEIQAQANERKFSEQSTQAAGGNQNSETGLTPKLFEKVEVKTTEVKPVQANPTEVKQVEQAGAQQDAGKQAEGKQSEGKQSEGTERTWPVNTKGAQTASINPSQTQNEFGLQNQNNSLPQADLTQVQSSKLPEPPVNIPRMAQVIFGQITQKAKLLITPGTTEMQIQLKPDFLGKMNLSITSENGLVTAKFNTESYRVKEVIEANLNTLKDSLAQQGVKVDQLVVNVSTQKDYHGYQEQNHSYYHRNTGKSTKAAGAINETGFEKVFPADLESRNIQAYYGNTVDFKA